MSADSQTAHSECKMFTCIIVAEDVETERGPRPVARVTPIRARDSHEAAMLRAGLICDGTPSGQRVLVVCPPDADDLDGPAAVDVYVLERFADGTLTAVL